MPKLQLENGVYLVDGYTASCIYDLRNEFARIYWLDSECRNLVHQYTMEIPQKAFFPDVISTILNAGLATIRDGENNQRLPIMTRDQSIVHAWIEITEKCQLRCVYCYGEFGDSIISDQKSISINDANFVLEWLSSSNIRSIQIIGGEPFVIKGVVRHLVRGLHAQGMSVEIYTNGLLLKKDDLDFLSAHGVRLAVSIFGATEAEAAAVTGYVHTFDEQKRSIKMLESHGIRVRYSITRTSINSDFSTRDIAAIFGIPDSKTIREDIARPVGRAAGKNILNKQLEKNQYIRREYFSRNVRSSVITNNIKGHSCFMQKICISPNLDIYPCTMEKTICYGNMVVDSAAQIEKSSLDYRFASKDMIATCSVCEYRYVCFDCRPKRTADFYSTSTGCLYDPHLSAWREVS